MLPGFAKTALSGCLEMSLPAFPIADVPLETAAFVEEAVDLFRLEWRAGVTVRSSVDLV